MIEKNFTISILIPTFNDSEQLKELLDQEEIHASQLEGLLELREKKEADFLLIH